MSDRKLSKLIARLGSTYEGEQIAALEALRRRLEETGRDFTDLALLVEQADITEGVHPADTEEEIDLRRVVRECIGFELYRDEKELDFLETLKRWVNRGNSPSEKQRKWLFDIYSRKEAEGGR